MKGNGKPSLAWQRYKPSRSFLLSAIGDIPHLRFPAQTCAAEDLIFAALVIASFYGQPVQATKVAAVLEERHRRLLFEILFEESGEPNWEEAVRCFKAPEARHNLAQPVRVGGRNRAVKSVRISSVVVEGGRFEGCEEMNQLVFQHPPFVLAYKLPPKRCFFLTIVPQAYILVGFASTSISNCERTSK